MPPKSNVPIRIGGSRLRTGCKTCKLRHVKCDEGRPTCANCQKRNRQCIYEEPQTLSQRSTPPVHDQSRLAVSRAVQSLRQAVAPSVTASINPQGSFDLSETNAIQYFVTYLGKELAGSFSDAVWCDVLPRVAQHEPAIWHGMVATSMLDTNLRINYHSKSESPNKSAIIHYNKAIHELHKRLEGAKDALCKDMILLSCILLAVFECLQSHYKPALLHINGGMRLLAEWIGEARTGNQGGLGTYLDRTALQSLFMSLDSQAIQMGAVGFQDFSYSTAFDDRLQSVAIFSTIEDAHLFLNQIFHRMSLWSDWVDTSTPCGGGLAYATLLCEAQKLQARLDEWDAAFEVLLRFVDRGPATILLMIQRKSMQAYLGKHLDGPSELEWDKYLPLFEESVTLAESYMELLARGSTATAKSGRADAPLSEGPRPSLTIAMDIVLPLFLICTRCRNSGVRRRALKLLWRCDRKQGIWDSQQGAWMAEKLIDMEESAAWDNGYIPESARMSRLDIQLGEERSAEVSHKALAQDPGGYKETETFAEEIAW